MPQNSYMIFLLQMKGYKGEFARLLKNFLTKKAKLCDFCYTNFGD